jgi:hypothetical protein
MDYLTGYIPYDKYLIEIQVSPDDVDKESLDNYQNKRHKFTLYTLNERQAIVTGIYEQLFNPRKLEFSEVSFLKYDNKEEKYYSHGTPFMINGNVLAPLQTYRFKFFQFMEDAYFNGKESPLGISLTYSRGGINLIKIKEKSENFDRTCFLMFDGWKGRPARMVFRDRKNIEDRTIEFVHDFKESGKLENMRILDEKTRSRERISYYTNGLVKECHREMKESEYNEKINDDKYDVNTRYTISQRFNSSGKKTGEWYTKEGSLIGRVVRSNDRGKILTNKTYNQDSQLHGEFFEDLSLYDHQGNVLDNLVDITKGHYHNGKRHGHFIVRNGNELNDLRYINGILHGYYHYSNQETETRIRGFYVEGKRHGEWIKERYDSDKDELRCIDEITYNNGKKVYWCSFDREGRPRFNIKYKNGKKNGICEFFKGGQLHTTVEYGEGHPKNGTIT